MGWNAGYTVFEHVAIGLHDLGRLDVATLDVLGTAFSDTDIDSGGSRGLVAKDGLDVVEVVVSLKSPRKWARIRAIEDDEKRTEATYDEFDRVRRKWRWG